MTHKSDIVFFDEKEKPIGNRHTVIIKNTNIWNAFERVSAEYAEKNKGIPLRALSKGMLLLLVIQCGIPKGTAFIQR